jgi:hypothetical protein
LATDGLWLNGMSGAAVAACSSSLRAASSGCVAQKT